MALSPLKPRDNSKEEQERYQRDLEDKAKNPHKWGISRSFHKQLEERKSQKEAIEESKPKKKRVSKLN